MMAGTQSVCGNTLYRTDTYGIMAPCSSLTFASICAAFRLPFRFIVAAPSRSLSGTSYLRVHSCAAFLLPFRFIFATPTRPLSGASRHTQVWAATDTLKSDWALEMAKDAVVEMIKSKYPTTPASTQSPSPKDGKDGSGGDGGSGAAEKNEPGVDGDDDVSHVEVVNQNSQGGDK